MPHAIQTSSIGQSSETHMYTKKLKNVIGIKMSVNDEILEGMFRKYVQIVYHCRSLDRLPDTLYYFEC
jgi:hypothetical protein